MLIYKYNIKRLRTDCDKNNLSRNRTIVELVKSMLHTKKLPLYLQTEATATFIYVKNQTETLEGSMKNDMAKSYLQRTNFRKLHSYTKRSKEQIRDKFRKIFDNRLQREKQSLSILFRRNVTFVEILFSTKNIDMSR